MSTPESQAEPTPEEELQAKRRKRSILLLASGSVTLILPLLALAYIKANEAKAVHAPSASVVFDRREQGDAKVNVTQTAAPVAPEFQIGAPASSLPVAGGPAAVQSGASSLDFVKEGTFPEKKPAAPAAAAPVPAAAPAPVTAAEADAPKPAAKKGAKKPFNSPKLQGTTSITSFKAGSAKAAGGRPAKGAAPVPAPGADATGVDIEAALKNVSGGVNNPEVQKYLKAHGQ